MHIGRSYRYIAFSLALIIAVSSLGMSVNVHYCQGHLSGVSLFPKGKKECHEITSESSKQSCCKTSQVENEPCCSDKASIVSLDFDSPGISDIVYSDLDFVKAPPAIAKLLEVNTPLIITSTGLDPPEDTLLSGSDIRIAFSSFLC